MCSPDQSGQGTFSLSNHKQTHTHTHNSLSAYVIRQLSHPDPYLTSILHVRFMRVLLASFDHTADCFYQDLYCAPQNKLL